MNKNPIKRKCTTSKRNLYLAIVKVENTMSHKTPNHTITSERLVELVIISKDGKIPIKDSSMRVIRQIVILFFNLSLKMIIRNVSMKLINPKATVIIAM